MSISFEERMEEFSKRMKQQAYNDGYINRLCSWFFRECRPDHDVFLNGWRQADTDLNKGNPIILDGDLLNLYLSILPGPQEMVSFIIKNVCPEFPHFVFVEVTMAKDVPTELHSEIDLELKEIFEVDPLFRKKIDKYAWSHYVCGYLSTEDNTKRDQIRSLIASFAIQHKNVSYYEIKNDVLTYLMDSGKDAV